METVSVEVPSSSPSQATEPEPSPPILRDPVTGRFPKGVSGNPNGRPLGSQNRASLVKQFIEEKLTDKLDKEALALMQKAINMAKQGDRQMLKLLLGDMMAPTRQAAQDSGSKNTAVQVNVTIDNYTAPTKGESPVIDVQSTEVNS